MKPSGLIHSAIDHFLEWDEHALSAYSCAGLASDDIARRAAGRLPHNKIRESTVGAIRNLGQGYDVVPWGRNCYVQIRLPGPPTEGSMIQLAAAFAKARPKPTQEGGSDAVW